MRCFKPLGSSIKTVAIGQDHPRTNYEDPGGNFGARWRWVVNAKPRSLYLRDRYPLPIVQKAGNTIACILFLTLVVMQVTVSVRRCVADGPGLQTPKQNM